MGDVIVQSVAGVPRFTFIINLQTKVCVSSVVSVWSNWEAVKGREAKERGQGCSNDYLTLVGLGHQGACGVPVFVSRRA